MKCPICKKPVDTTDTNAFLPFCSKRCKMVDLGKWLDGKYILPDDSLTAFPDSSGGDEG